VKNMFRALVIIIMMSAARAGAQTPCDAAILRRIHNAGIDGPRAQVLCSTATALRSRSLVVSLNFIAVGRLINAIGPIAFEVPASPLGNKIELRDLRLCPATGAHSAIVLAVGSLGSGTQMASQDPVITGSQALQSDDCGRPFSDVGRRLTGSAPTSSRIVVARLTISWEPWNLRVRLLQVAGAIDVNSVSSSEVLLPLTSIQLPLGSTSISFLPILFLHGSDATIFLTEFDPSLQKSIGRAADVPSLTAIIGATNNVKRVDEDFVIRVNDVISSRLTEQWARTGGLAIETGDKSIGRLTISDPVVKTGNQTFALNFKTTTQSGERYAVNVNLEGAVLALRQVDVQAATICAGDDLACQLKAALAPVLAGVVTSAYKGKTLHSFVPTNVIALRSDALVCDIYPVVTRIRAQPGELQILGRFIFERPSR
jgi:hypothetical protein